MPSNRRPAVKVVVFQWPWGTAARHRSPHRLRPRNRAIFVDAAVSSTKISLSGLRSSWPSNQALRRREHRGAAVRRRAPSFFERDAAPVEEQPDRRWRRPHTAIDGKALTDLGKRDVRHVLDEAENEGLMRVELRTRRLALFARLHLAGLTIAAIPGSGRRNPDPEAPRCLPRRNPIFNRGNHPPAKVGAQAPRHLHLLPNHQEQ
jgi:hypothetical protein